MANYSDLYMVGGEVRNTAGRRFSSEDDLASYLGVNKSAINWGGISKTAPTTSAPSSGIQATPQLAAAVNSPTPYSNNSTQLTVGGGMGGITANQYGSIAVPGASLGTPATVSGMNNNLAGLNTVYPAIGYSTPAQPTSPAVVSSNAARTQTSNNLNTLTNIEQFYKPDPNNPTVYNAKGEALDYDSYISQGGKSDFSNVVNGPVPKLNTTGATSNPALNAQLNDMNTRLPGVNSPEVTAAVNDFNANTAAVAAATAAARAAADRQDFYGLNQFLEQIKTARQEQTNLAQKVYQSMQKSEAEKAQELELQNLKASEAAGMIQIEGQNIAMPFIVGQQAALEKQAQLKINNAVANLKRLSDNRIDETNALTFLYNAQQNNISDAIQMYQMTAPENIYSDVNDKGELVTVMQNPITGETLMQNLGKVGSNKEWAANVQEAKDLMIPTPFYSTDGRTIKNAQTGRAYENMDQFIADGGKADASNVTWMTTDRQIEKQAVINLMDEYQDAGIKPSDTLEVATQKMRSSRIYLDKVRGPVGTYSERAMGNQNSILEQARNMPKGTDGKVNPETYLDLASRYIGANGSVNDFMAAIVPERYMTTSNATWVRESLSGKNSTLNAEAEAQQLMAMYGIRTQEDLLEKWNSIPALDAIKIGKSFGINF